jgi:hypothetical protein
MTSAPLKFDRWSMSWRKTWALDLFRTHLTEINDAYWSYISGRSFSDRVAAVAGKDVQTAALFGFFGDDAYHAPTFVPQWRASIATMDEWVRLHAILSLSSFFELYLKMATELAIRSKPHHFSAHSMSDGILLIKSGNSVPERKIESIAKTISDGTWPDRMGCYIKYFGSAPGALTSSVTSLDKLRLLRNKIAHVYGLDTTTRTPPSPQYPWQKFNKLSVSTQMLKKYLELVRFVAAGVDEHLCSTFIGEFEIARLLHEWVSANGIDTSNHEDCGLKFKKYLGANTGIFNGVPRDYFSDLCQYYSGL